MITLIQAVDGLFYEDPYIDLKTVGLFVRDGIVYAGAKAYHKSSMKSARNRVTSAAKKGGIFGKAAKVGEETMTLLQGELTKVLAFEWILDAEIPIPVSTQTYRTVDVIDSPNAIIGFRSEEDLERLKSFWAGIPDQFLEVVLGSGSAKLARRRLSAQLPEVKIGVGVVIGETRTVRWHRNYFGTSGKFIEESLRNQHENTLH